MAKKDEVVENELAVQEETPMDMTAFAGLDLADLGFSPEELKSLTGMENIDSSEISIPYATLISKASKENKIGDIVLPDGTVIAGGDGVKLENISILNIQPVRIYFPTPFNPNNTFICRSLDGVVGAPDGKYAGTPCSQCEFSKYPEGGGSSPCRDQRLLLCAREDGSLFHIQVGGVGVGVWKKFMSAQLFHLLPKAGSILGAIKVDIGVKMVDTDYGAFPALDFQTDKVHPIHSVERIKASLTSLKSYKEFASVHAASAADAARVQMAAGEGGSDDAPGENAAIF